MSGLRSWRMVLVGMVLVLGGGAVYGQGNNVELERDPDFIAGRTALDDGFFDVAAMRFESYVNKTVSKRKKAYGSIFLLRAWYGQERYEQIIEWLRANWDISRGTRYEAASIYWYARAKHASGLPVDALNHLRDFETRFPGDEFIPYALRLRGQAWRDHRRLDMAEATFAAFDADYPDREEIPENLLDWAAVLVQLKRTDEAAAKLQRIVEDYPGHAGARRARLWLGQWALDRGEGDVAAGWLNPLVLDGEAEVTVRVDAWFALARAAVSQGQLTNALAALRQGEQVAVDPDRKVEARIDQARLLMELNRLNEAVDLMNQTVFTLASHPQASRAQLELADLLRAQARYEQAADAYQRYIESFSDPAGLRHAHYSRAWCLWALRRYAEAALAFEKAYGLLRNQVLREQALVKAGDAYFLNNQYRLAASTYERAIQEFADSASRPDWLYQAGESFARIGDATNAVRVLRAVADSAAAPSVAASGLMRLARFHEEQRAWEDAIAVYREIMSRFAQTDRYPVALLGQAILKYRLGRYAQALSDFDRLVEDFPATAWAEQASFLRAWCIYQLGDTERALGMANAFLVQHPVSPWAADVAFWLAEHDYNHVNYGAAETNFASVAVQFPTNRLAEQSLFWAARAAMEQKAFRRAIDEYLNPLIRDFPESPMIPEARFAQGDALTEIGDFAGAILAFNEIVTRFPEHPLVPRALGRIGDSQFTLGSDRPARYREALETYRRLLGHARITRDLAVQAEYKLARTYERLGLLNEATSHYLNVVYGWLADRQQGLPVDEVWLVRSAFAAAGIKEGAGAWEEAVRIYQRVVDAEIPAAADATIRIDRIRNQRQKSIPPSAGTPSAGR